MQQIARNVTMEGCGALRDCRYLLHDRDTKYTQSFRAIIASGQVEPLVLPARSPNLNAYAERWVRSVKEECLSKVILSLSETYALKYWWCSPPRTGIASVRPTVWMVRGIGASLCSDRCVRASL